MRGRIVLGGAVAALLLQGSVWADQRTPPTIDPSHGCRRPQYPAQARRFEQQGTVVLRFLIGPDGVAQKSEIQSSSGYPELDQAAQDALMLCHFNPGKIDGNPDPNPGWAQIRYTWKLDATTGQGGGAPAPAPTPVAMPFVLKCSAHPSDADFADQLALVEAVQPKVGGSARLVLPPVGGAPQTVCAERFHHALAETLRKSQLFDRLDVEENGVENIRPKSKGEDFTLWIEGGLVAAAYRGGPRVALLNNGAGLAAWSRGLPSHLKGAQTHQDESGFSISTSMIDGQPYIAFRGKEYLSTADIEFQVRAAAEAEAEALPPGKPLGKRLHVLMAPEAAVIGQAEAINAKAVKLLKSPTAPDIATLALSELSLQLVGYATSQGRLRALRQIGLFEVIDVEEGETADPPLGSYDAVMWTEAAAPLKWKIKDTLGVVHEPALTLPLPAWLDAVRSAVALGNLVK